MQRLKGLTAGSLPTFIDASDNFASPAIREDNWLTQAMKAGRRVLMAGDDTWARLFPGLSQSDDAATSRCFQLGSPVHDGRNSSGGHSSCFPSAESFPLPSFNVFDLHSVDDGVMHLMVPAMKDGACGVARAA